MLQGDVGSRVIRLLHVPPTWYVTILIQLPAFSMHRFSGESTTRTTEPKQATKIVKKEHGGIYHYHQETSNTWKSYKIMY
jgi:hypothetical protein